MVGGDRGIGSGGKEGDWECGGCRNRNYAFRSFCNRCKQPRVLVDIKTPADSKWLPRIGDWICTACTNNNYASREKCKKCGQPKELAAMPAVAIHGASVSSHSTYFARTQGRMEQLMNVGSFQSAMSLNSSWLGGAACQYRNQATDPYGTQQPSNWLLGDGNLSGTSYSGNMNQLPAVLNGNGWRSGDWMCTCGFHNYSSRLQCKKCNAPSTIATPSSLFNPSVTGTKRLASEEFVNNWDNKRLNAGQAYGSEQQCTGFESIQNPGAGKSNNIYPAIQNGNNGILQNWQVNHQVPHVPAIHTLIGKGAKQWREGDWMCSNCHNHNYASRAECNRCRTQREVPDQSVTVA